MSGIVGINKPNEFDLINKMLDKISHRANRHRKIFSTDNSTFGIISNYYSEDELTKFQKEKMVAHNLYDIHYSIAKEKNGKIELKRDFIGVVPLYYGTDESNSLCFASEVKALLLVTKDINELKPGMKYFDNNLISFDKLDLPNEYLNIPIEVILKELREKIETSIFRRIENKREFGSWLSGGIDSSVIASIASSRLKNFYTFAGGLKNSNDLKFAKLIAEYIKSNHFEIVVNRDQILEVLPEVIYYLESFDAYLVRSSIINYIVSSIAKDYVQEVFSGESGDELFAGYEYLKFIPVSELPVELFNIIKALANTAFQRVDRSAYSHGIIPHIPFSDPDVVKFALQIPPELKIKDGIEKWILRESMKDILPEAIINRPKEKFWQGSGFKNILEDYAESKISDFDFNAHRELENGFIIRTKEEYLYYKIFEEHFGSFDDFKWLGFTKISSIKRAN